MSGASLDAPSRLPDWNLLTIACHLRYGALASQRMTDEGLAGVPTSFYPLGRSFQRPATLAPGPGETSVQVVESLGDASETLHHSWAALTPSDWSTQLEEPEGIRDIGSMTIAVLALLRLTEVEVHGNDLGVGLVDWSETFVIAALPFRIAWLATRRSKAADPNIQGSWLLVAEEGDYWRVSVRDNEVTSAPTDRSDTADCEIRATSRDLLAILLGRPTTSQVSTRGDVGLARAFGRAFPGP